jgi:hypothetical protein
MQETKVGRQGEKEEMGWEGIEGDMGDRDGRLGGRERIIRMG